jgi:8-oxo-dGTP diphosphatase
MLGLRWQGQPGVQRTRARSQDISAALRRMPRHGSDRQPAVDASWAKRQDQPVKFVTGLGTNWVLIAVNDGIPHRGRFAHSSCCINRRSLYDTQSASQQRHVGCGHQKYEWLIIAHRVTRSDCGDVRRRMTHLFSVCSTVWHVAVDSDSLPYMAKSSKLVAVKDGKVLLVRRVVDGVWMFPGGRKRGRETEKDCLRREIKEELPKLRLGGVRLWKRVTAVNRRSGRKMSDAIFIVRKATGTLKIGDKNEIDKAVWRKPRGVRLTPTSKYIVEHLFPKRSKNLGQHF